VGPDFKSIKVHQKMLTEAAEVFEKMFNSGFREGPEDFAEFPDDDPAAWEQLVEWCYKGSLPPLGKPGRTETRFTEEISHPYWV
jgi:hypothetical protein